MCDSGHNKDVETICSYCRASFRSTNEAVWHCAEEHEEENVSISWPNASDGGRTYNKRTFKVKGCDISGNRKYLTFNPITGKLQLPTKSSTDSPVRKLLKINTPTKSVHQQLFSENVVMQTSCSEHSNTLLENNIIYGDSEDSETILETTYTIPDHESMLADDETVRKAVLNLQQLLPSVTAHLAEHDRLSDWVSFFNLVATGEFHVNHIAAQLFLDVIKFSTIEDVRAMRYTPEVKEFWSVGQSIFRAKFLRFMGGYKTVSQVNEYGEKTENTMNKTDIAKVNFACPNVMILNEQKKKCDIECSKPGIIHSNIKAVAAINAEETKAYNLCLDGKKITAGFGKNLGEVDLFGHETKPYLTEKVNRLDIELLTIDRTKEELCKWMETDISLFSELNTDKKLFLYSKMIDILSIVSERVKEMRFSKVSKQTTLDKLLNMADEPWQKSKYSFGISSMKTQIYETNRCLSDAVELNGKIGLVAAACNDVEANYTCENIVDLQCQENYVCIKSTVLTQNQSQVLIPTHLVKQRSEQWYRERQNAKVTGSSIFRALGLSTLKEQQEHYDKVKDGSNKENAVPSNINDAMRHGVENEINAVGTLASKVLPVFVPSAKLHEEGYYKLPTDTNPDFLIVSPDGSCRDGDRVIHAVEIKCPVPGKRYTPDVHYKIPKYYVTQILAEMAALNCNSLLYLSWTPESATVLRALFDPKLWERIKSELIEVYDSRTGNARPSRKRPIIPTLLNDINTYITEKVSLLCEFPSTVSVNCSHGNVTDHYDDLTGSHSRKDYDTIKLEKEASIKNAQLSIHSIMNILSKATQCVNEMYNILRIPSKEVIVAVLSDLNRKYSQNSIHGVPIAYGLSGYSLKVECMRSMMNDIIETCYKNGIAVKSLSTDGQFYRVCVRDAQNKPLSLLQVAKDTWERVKKMTKAEQVQQLMNLNYEKHDSNDAICDALDSNLNVKGDTQQGPIVVREWKNQPWPKLYNPRRLNDLVKRIEKNNSDDDFRLDAKDLENMPSEVINTLYNEIGEDPTVSNNDDNILFTESGNIDTITMEENITEVQTEVDMHEGAESSEVNCEQPSLPDIRVDFDKVSEELLTKIVTDLKQLDTCKKNPKWKNLHSAKMKRLMSAEPSLVLRTFTKGELIACGTYFRDDLENVSAKKFDTMTKTEFANAFSMVFGHKTVIGSTKSPPKLRKILRDFLSKKLKKESLNAITATRIFLETDLPRWRQNAAFKDGIYIGDCQAPYVWYSQPEFFQSVGEYIVYLLDCHHLFVNARSYVCQHGISGLGVKKDAWIAVAEAGDSIETGLNRAMVVDLIDRQSNAIAQIVFGEKVERKMVELGWLKEAILCKRIREWYMAEDEPGLSVETRHIQRMNMRQLLLDSVNLADFPPPGTHVAGMPIVMFEGILTNIDRRIQLHAIVPGNAYNVRAPNTLAVENLFSGFQELDPKSTGVLLADDVPHAIETASYLIQTRLNPERPFEMRTSISARVYPTNVLHQDKTLLEEEVVSQQTSDRPTPVEALTMIPVIPHSFDLKQRSKKPKRKKGLVPDYDKPARGTMPVRQFHKSDSSKIIPHVRHGLNYDI